MKGRYKYNIQTKDGTVVAVLSLSLEAKGDYPQISDEEMNNLINQEFQTLLLLIGAEE